MEIEQSLHETIQATVQQIASNGIEYEQFLRNIHKDNPEYEFLRASSKHYHFYLQQLAAVLRPVASHHQKQSGWTSLPESAAVKLEQMPVGLMCEVVKEAARKGMEPYTTFTQEDVSKLMTEVLSVERQSTTTEVNEQVAQLQRFMGEARLQERKSKEAKEAAKKTELQQLSERAKKETKRPSELPGRVLTSEMGISHDGSVSGGVVGRYQGLGRTEDPYENFRRGQRR